MAVRVQDLPEQDRPRERLWSEGVGALADRELLALLIRSGSHGRSAIDLAAGLLVEHGGLRGLAETAPEELAATVGVGTAKAAALAAAFELVRRVGRAQGGEQSIIRTPADLAEVVLPLLASRRREEAWVVVLDGSHRLKRLVRIGLGSANDCLLPVREVLNAVLRNDGIAFAVAHNHPSRSPFPSRDDFEVTERLVSAAQQVGVEFVDHLIVGEGSWASLQEIGSFSSADGNAKQDEFKVLRGRHVPRAMPPSP